jgi:cellulose biosynthesis protein BcsQ
MTPVLTFFNNKGGVGKTSLVYHAAWMLSELDYTVLVVDLDPQANLTAAFLDEDTLAELWEDQTCSSGKTIFQCVAPLTRVGDIEEPELRRPADRLHLLPGDLALSGFEDLLSTEWPNCLGSGNLYRAFRVITAFWQVVQKGVAQSGANIVLVDVGPSLGAINRSALIATDFVAVPLAADLFSRQGLRNLGPTLRRWRLDWKKRRDNWADPDFALPAGDMRPIGYLIQQHGVRLSRPVKAYDRWARQMPAEYSRSVLGTEAPAGASDPQSDEHCIATVKHYRSLIPLAQDARKPIFSLSAGDGALGSHAAAARDAFRDFKTLVESILRRTHASSIAKP